jgi:hypothetical protein
MKVIISENRIKNIVFNWLDKNYGGAEPFKCDVSYHHTYYMKNGKTIFSFLPEWDFVRIQPDIFDTLTEIFGMDYDQSKYVLSEWVEKEYGLKETVVLKNVGGVRGMMFDDVARIYNEKNTSNT